MSRIALVDDDRNILTSVSMTLEAEGFEVETFNDGQSALDAFNKKLPDMAVFDIKMPRMDGMDLLQRVRQKTNMPVIFLTSKDDEIDEVLGLRMGADDYVKKPFSQRLLVERIRALLRRQEALDGAEVSESEETKMMVRGELTMDPLRHAVTWKGKDVTLTVTEFLLLQALAQRPGFVKSRDQLMDVAYDDQVYVDDRTIDSHIKRLRKKMRSVDSEFSAIETLYGIRLSLQRGMIGDAMSLSSRMDGVCTGTKGTDVVLGDDWVAPHTSDSDLREKRARRKLISVKRSPLAQKIITFNLVAIILMVAGILYLNPFRDSLVTQREMAMVTQAALVADMLEVTAGADGIIEAEPQSQDAGALQAVLETPLRENVYIYGDDGTLITSTEGMPRLDPAKLAGVEVSDRSTVISDFLSRVWSLLAFSGGASDAEVFRDDAAHLATLVGGALENEVIVDTGISASGSTVFAVAVPVTFADASGTRAIGAVGLISGEGEIDDLVQVEREQILQVFIIAILVSIGLSLVLASTIANPLADLAAAAEIGRDKNSRKVSPGRVRIPDLSGRPDEIGRLSSALRGMVAALYDRIDANEQFAADVAHEIKNPLASLRSAVGSLRMIKKEEHRQKLLDVIDHDVRRLDRLVSDISNASRLDSELVKEEEEDFNLLKMLSNLTEFLAQEAQEKGVDFITDLPDEPIIVAGLEARLAQVFVNLITNAISFCEDGDAIRVWVRKRDSRVLVVVEDTGPGIPDQALSKIFKRFYSERPEGQFGNNSGLGLAISKQIVEAHGGVIWAENIRPTDADITSEPLGARFVVGLPV